MTRPWDRRNPYEVQHFEECPAHEDQQQPPGECACEQISQFYEDVCVEWAVDQEREDRL